MTILVRKSANEGNTPLPEKKIPRAKLKGSLKERKQARKAAKGYRDMLMEVNPTLKRKKAKRIAKHAVSTVSPYRNAASDVVQNHAMLKATGMKVIVEKKNTSQPKGQSVADEAERKWKERVAQRDKDLGIKNIKK